MKSSSLLLRTLGLATLASCQLVNPFSEAEKAVSEKMKDPYSVKFSNVEHCERGGGVRGEYNAKNSYGAYAGVERFLYLDQRVYLTGQDNLSYADYNEAMGHCYSQEVMDATRNEMENLGLKVK